MPLIKSIAAWLVILALAIANGALREAVLVPMLGKTGGLVLSGLLLSLFVLVVAFAFVRLNPGVTALQGILIGILWLCLTLAFEFGFGRWVQHKPWAELFEAYTFKGGNIWPVVLVVSLLAPYLAARMRARSANATSRVTPT